LYYGVLNYQYRGTPLWEKRDRVIISKAHGAYAALSILSDLGILPREQWESFGTPQSQLRGCIERQVEWGIEAGCGALGHGLPMAVGLAYGMIKQRIDNTIFCLMGDGELQEGSNWEALQFAVKYDLHNLILIVDRNRLQAMDFIENILDKSSQDIIRRFEGFGVKTYSCDGHQVMELVNTIKSMRLSKIGIPQVLLAETVKGKGFSCMENMPKFHYRAPTKEDLENAGYQF
jgi:transketolase